MSRLLRVVLVPSVVLALAGGAAAVTRTAGIDDAFEPPADPVHPSSELVEVLSGFGGVMDYDLIAGVNAPANRQVAHTFVNLVGVESATLELRVRAGLTAGVANDGIFLSFVDSPDDVYHDEIVWRRSFGAVDSIPPDYPVPDPGLFGPDWFPGEEALIQVDLAALPQPDGPPLDILAEVALRGFLDVSVSDDTAVDYAVLEIEFGITGVDPAPVAPVRLSAFPNPFRSSTTLRFARSGEGPARVRVFDAAGREIRRLGSVAGGGATVGWDGRDGTGRPVPAGVYFVRLEADGGVATRRVVRLR
jgi:hypothetical protein